jgi:nucleoid-associated protein YgaU
MVKATFKGSFDKLLRLAKANLLSPDLTHLHTVKAGDTLYNLCQAMYESPRYVQAVARANNLTNFRQLQVGQTLIFPPFDKKSTR